MYTSPTGRIVNSLQNRPVVRPESRPTPALRSPSLRLLSTPIPSGPQKQRTECHSDGNSHSTYPLHFR